VVVTGADLPGLQGVAPGNVVAFRWETGAWVPIPVQVDERKLVTYDQVYNGLVPSLLLIEAYADAGTYTGADDDPLLDANDEVAWMAHDAGERAPQQAALPTGVVPGSGVELQLTDALDAGEGRVYLFASNGSLDPAAGADYVSYTFDLLAGTYPADYNLASGPNPENSTVVTPLYATHFADRWIRDEVSVFAGGANGVDILDRHKNLFAPGTCGRSEDTFSAGEGAFFANIDGPVRGIRSYMGANSGPLTQRLHRFYEGRQDLTTFLRVHAIPGVLDVYDYSREAGGENGQSSMTYANSLNPTGVPIDGAPDVVTAGVPVWEMVTGLQGTLTIAGFVNTDIVPFTPTSYYNDDSSPTPTQCTGDAFEYGQSGLWVDSAIPNTEPNSPPFNILEATRVIYYDSPNRNASDAAQRADQALTPLSVTVQPFPSAAVPALAPPVLAALGALLAGLGAATLRQPR
jgi:hypothetical protein